MSGPLLSIIIPTVGRAGLVPLLRSIRAQAPSPAEVEVLVVGDAHGGTWSESLAGAQLAVDVCHQARMIWHDGGRHAWGHPQRNHGATLARGRFLAWSQDDNVYRPGALAAMLDAAAHLVDDPMPALFRVMTRLGYPVWLQEGLLAERQIDADCILVPNVPDALGTWTNRYEGDWDFIRETVHRWHHRALWCEDIIAEPQKLGGGDFVGHPMLHAPVEAAR